MNSAIDPRIQSRDWRWRQSLWMLPGFLCCGLLTWLSFLIIAVQARKRAWWIACAGYAAVAAVAVGLTALSPSDLPEGESTAPARAGTWILLAAWLVGVVHMLIVNRDWLLWKAGPVPWYQAATTPPPEYNVAPGISVPPPDTFYAPPPSDQGAVAGPVAKLPEPRAVQSVRVNTATPEELATALEIPLDRAQSLVAARTAGMTFRSAEQVRVLLDLQPHEWVRVRGRIDLTTPPRPGGSGRVLDV